METLTHPNAEAIQPSSSIEVQIDGMPVVYHQQAGARRTEYTGDTSALIDGGEAGGDGLGSFEMGDISLPVVAKFTVENNPQAYQRDASPESEFLVVDIRGLGLQDAQSTSVSGLKAAVETGQRFGKLNHAEDAPQYALVNLTAIQRRSREGGSLFSISTISRDPENPTVIRRDHTLHGEATVDSLSALGLGESNVTVTSDAEGKLTVSMTQESDGALTVDAAQEPLNQPLSAPRPTSAEARIQAERKLWEKRILGRLAVEDAFRAETLNYLKTKREASDLWKGAQAYANTQTSAYSNAGEWMPPQAPDTPLGPERSAAANQPLQTTEDVYNRIADLRAANMSDKQIKKTLLRDLHPDFNPGVNPDLAKVVTNEFRPQPQEYRNHNTASQAAHAEPAPEPSPNSESTAGAAGSDATPKPSAAVVPVPPLASQTEQGSGQYAQAA